MPPRRSESVVFTVVVSVIAALAAIPIAVVLALSGEPRSLVIAAVLAFVPVGPVLASYLWLDRYEPEPRTLLAAGLAWGAFVATLVALLVQGIGGFVVGFTESQALAVVAPISEEATKGLFLLLLLVWRRNELDGVLDGIVYAGMVGIGFAFTENILYLAAAYDGTPGQDPGGLAGLGVTFVVRCLASPFAHPFFTAFTGIGVGLAISSRSRFVQIAAPVGGYLLAVLMHAAWNGSTLLAEGLGFFGVYFLVMAPIFVLVIVLAIWVRSRERVLLAQALDDAARRGLMPAADIPHVVDLASRRRARRFARDHGGAAGAAWMREYQQAAVELGYLHHRVLRGTAPPQHLERGQRFVDRMHLARRQIAFPVTPAGGTYR
ncbi:PrsW family intramembrane metalloprotease [Nocardioides daejeonensis]|uniref:PrsW family intramembrane metalloprotease n=1 Tax=Nocardioides daejeonensis TaxID=1046556 RepID=UPI000D74D7E4|nr:PrsW family intramembrane metalloprotease [Nocardioides daejeonensis]